MDDLVQWLGGQLDVDERIARAVTTEGAWRVGSSHGGASVEGEGWTVAGVDALDGAHIAEHDPARVLREIAAKRELLRRYEALTAGVLVLTSGAREIQSEYRRVILPSLAAGYSDRPGYREEWRP